AVPVSSRRVGGRRSAPGGRASAASAASGTAAASQHAAGKAAKSAESLAGCRARRQALVTRHEGKAIYSVGATGDSPARVGNAAMAVAAGPGVSGYRRREWFLRLSQSGRLESIGQSARY